VLLEFLTDFSTVIVQPHWSADPCGHAFETTGADENGTL